MILILDDNVTGAPGVGSAGELHASCLFAGGGGGARPPIPDPDRQRLYACNLVREINSCNKLRDARLPRTRISTEQESSVRVTFPLYTTSFKSPAFVRLDVLLSVAARA